VKGFSSGHESLASMVLEVRMKSQITFFAVQYGCSVGFMILIFKGAMVSWYCELT
jgi:hypothetical protein